MIKSFETFVAVNEARQRALYRNTGEGWLAELLKLGKVGRTSSLSFAEDSGGMDDFGGLHVRFDAQIVFRQDATEIFYDPEFFKDRPDMAQYVLGYRSEEEYYWDNDLEGRQDAIENFQLPWQEYIETFEHEREVVVENMTYEDGLVTGVRRRGASADMVALLKDRGIPDIR